MANAFADITFTPSVKAAQSLYGSREANQGFELSDDPKNEIRESEAGFIELRDSFYMASISENGWPYVQHRGGPVGFLKVLDSRTLGFADFKGNRQYLSVGNINALSRVSLILMDYPNRIRLKIWGTAKIVHERDNPGLIEALENPRYRARIERAIVITVEAVEWNCPQHIIPRYTEAEIQRIVEPLLEENKALKALKNSGNTLSLGSGELPLVVAGIYQITPSIRVFRLEAAEKTTRSLPLVSAGAHLKVPYLDENNETKYRHYSICHSDGASFYEIAVLKQADGLGGSVAIHQQYQVGTQIKCSLPKNNFALSSLAGPVVLIAGGIGITPIRSFVTALTEQNKDFELHYTGKSVEQMAFAAELKRQVPGKVTLYSSSLGERLSVESILSKAAKNAVFYVCGPQSLIDEVHDCATKKGFSKEQVNSERFGYSPDASGLANPVTVVLQKSGLTLEVPPHQSILDAVTAAGVAADSDCRVGDCGMCRVKVLGGEVLHHDHVLTDADKKKGLMCICVSRASSDELIIDL